MENQLAEIKTLELFMPAFELTEAKARRDQLVAFVRDIMIKDTDFGVIPGTDKPTLLKPGAEKLCSFFGLTTRFSIIEDISDWNGKESGEPFFFYHYKCSLSRGTYLVAEGEGSCNSHEKKYRWRNQDRVCPNCGKATIKRSKFAPKDAPDEEPGWYCFGKIGGCGAQFSANADAIVSQVVGQIPNPDIADSVNTIQKMAQKRALIAATLIAVNASEFFTQDVEDMADLAPAQESASARTVNQPPAKAAPAVGNNNKGKKFNERAELITQIVKTIPYYGAAPHVLGMFNKELEAGRVNLQMSDAELLQFANEYATKAADTKAQAITK